MAIDVTGTWGSSRSADVAAVLASALTHGMRGIRVPTDRIPTRLIVQGEPQAPCPCMYAVDHPDGSAMMRLTSIDLHWSQLAYQFGHELGHVLAGSWDGESVPRTPSHWLEEALAEAFSLFVLRRMAAAWVAAPPYQNWTSYAASLGAYADNRLEQLSGSALAQVHGEDLTGWYRESAAQLHSAKGLEDSVWPVVPPLLRMLEEDHARVASYAALNRWPERAALPLDEYLDAWAARCADLGLSAALPGFLRARLLNGA